MAGRFVTFEGPEGAGKTTQVELLRRVLGDQQPVMVREPGGTLLGERIRDLLLLTSLEMSGEAEMYLFMAARAELVETVIRPALQAGRIVVADRYHDSTLAYQGGARGARTTWPESFPRPDITFLLALAPEVGLERQLKAGKQADRVEGRGLAFHQALAAEYERLAAAEPGRFVRLDATQEPSLVHAEVVRHLSERLEVAVP